MSHGAVDRLVREESGRVLAALVRITGDFALAEEVVQEALIVALTRWPGDGVPANPRAWVVTTARNLAIDRIRRRQRFDDRAQVLAELESLRAPHAPDAGLERYPDDRLRLLFTCCHPALDLPSRVALTLRTVGGLTSDEIARAFLTRRTTMQQRIVRARKRIATEGIPYETPPPGQLEERLSGVLAVVYLVFNEGYGATSGATLVRHELADEAIHLGRILHGLAPDHAETAGLLALMLLQHARRDAREHEGRAVLLEDQDRSLWDADAIAEGRTLVREALTAGGPRAGPYALQAAIAALHAEAPDFASTDWLQIERLYRVLRVRQPGPVVALGHAVAAAHAHGVPAGLAMLEGLEDALPTSHLLHAARGALLARAGRVAEARRAYDRALEHVGNAPERRFLRERRAALDD